MKRDRQEVLRLLAEHRDRLHQRHSELTDVLLPDARRTADRVAEEAAHHLHNYRATPQGIAESLREIDLAVITGADRHHLHALRRKHLAAEQESENEYLQRSQRWGHSPGDGPVRACELGTNRPVVSQILRDQIMGSHRHDPAADKARINLMRIVGGERLRTVVTVPAQSDLSLCGVIASAFTTAAVRERVIERLRMDPATWAPLTAALAGPTPPSVQT